MTAFNIIDRALEFIGRAIPYIVIAGVAYSLFIWNLV